MRIESAHGGENWSSRDTSFKQDMAAVWGDWGASSECGRLRAVLLHRPGSEIEGITNADSVQWLELCDPELARQQHDALAQAYRDNGVTVHYVGAARPDKPNSHFVRDLMLMTPEGAIISRPASTVRAGEERCVAETLAKLGVPILMSVHGTGVFEGADVAMVDERLAFLAEGYRTNEEGADQVEWALRQSGFHEVVRVQMPYASGHIDGVLNIVDRDLAVICLRTPLIVCKKLEECGFRIVELPEKGPDDRIMTMNFVALAPGHVLMPAGCPGMKRLLEAEGCTCVEVEISELRKGGGGIHCMTGILKRDTT